jgi:hypothetical protein
LNESGLRFIAPAPGDPPWVLHDAGSYWLDWVDDEGYRLRDVMRSEIHVQRDASPTVSIVAPSPNSYFTNQARVPLRLIAKDDLGVASVDFEFSGARRNLYQSLERPGAARSDGGLPTGNRDESVTIEDSWDLKQVSGIQPGDVLEVRVTASDFKPQSSQDALLQIAIVSAQELSARIDQRQVDILGQLGEALRFQKTAYAQTMLLQEMLDEAGALSGDDVDYLQATELNQRHVQSVLTGDLGGVQQVIRALLDELENNRIPESPTSDRLREILAEVDQLSKTQLPRIRAALTRAFKCARADQIRRTEQTTSETLLPPLQVSATRQSLSTAAAAQEQVIGRLEKLSGQLTDWDSVRQIAHDIQRVYDEQAAIADATTALTTAAQALSDLAPRERSALKRLANRQVDLARSFERLNSKLRARGQQLSGRDQDRAREEALKVTRGAAIAGLMRDAAEHLDRNRVGQATRLHRELLEELQQLRSQLNPRLDGQSLEQLRPVVEDLLMRQQDVTQRTAAVDQQRQTDSSRDPDVTLDALAEAQRQVQKDTTAAAQTVASAKVFQGGLRSAADSMRDAARLLDAGVRDPRVGALQQRANSRLRAILAALEGGQERRQAANSSGRPQPRTGREIMLSLPELLLVRAMQVEVNQRTTQLDQQRTAASELTESGRINYQQLAEDQGRLVDLARDLLLRSVDSQPSASAGSSGASQSDLDEALQAAGLPGFGTLPGRDASSGQEAAEPPSGPPSPAGEDLGDASSEEPIGDRIVAGMRTAHAQLRQRNASSVTQDQQRAVVADLDRLISRLASEENANTAGQSAKEPSGAAPGESPSGDPGRAPGDALAADPASPKPSDAAEAIADQLLAEVWGQLPAHLQQQIQSPTREDFLPQFETLIIEYYRRLAEMDDE